MFLFLFLVQISEACICSDIKSSLKCEQTGYCYWQNQTCQEGGCQIQTTKCISPKCLRSNDVCIEFNKNLCQLLGQQDCTSYPGCYYDYLDQSCQQINNCNQLKIHQCNGQLNGTQCVLDIYHQKCLEFAECKDLTQDSCNNQFPQCVLNKTNQQCQQNPCNNQLNHTCLNNQQCVLNNIGCQSANKCSQVDTEGQCEKVGCYWNSESCTDCPSQKFQLMIMLCYLMIIYI